MRGLPKHNRARLALALLVMACIGALSGAGQWMLALRGAWLSALIAAGVWISDNAPRRAPGPFAIQCLAGVVAWLGLSLLRLAAGPGWAQERAFASASAPWSVETLMVCLFWCVALAGAYRFARARRRTLSLLAGALLVGAIGGVLRGWQLGLPREAGSQIWVFLPLMGLPFSFLWLFAMRGLDPGWRATRGDDAVLPVPQA